MTRPVITFPDAQLVIRDALRAALATRSEPYAAGARVVIAVPSDQSPDGPRPVVQVRTDAMSRDARLNGEAVVRVIVWHDDEGAAVQLASLCEALLLAAAAPGLRSVGPVAGPLPTTDPDTGAPMTVFTIAARLAPVQL